MANIEPTKYDLKQCTLKLKDGATTPNELTIKFDDGTLTSNETREFEYVLDRGVLDTVRDGDQVPCELSFDGRFTAYKASSGNNMTIPEFLKNSGSTTLTSTGASCEPFAIDVELKRVPNCTVGLDSMEDETITWSDFRAESISVDFKTGKISVSGKCNVTAPTSVRG